MVRYYSDDGVFDAPVQKLWKLIEAHQEHMGEIHPGTVSANVKPQPDGSAIAEVVTKGPDGKPTAASKWRFVMKPPHTQSVEFLDGPMQGGWLTSTYLPEGNRTRVVTVAEWRVKGIDDDATLRKLADEFMENGFAEDSAYLKRMP